MTAYGYRIFTLSAFKGRGRTALDFGDMSEGGVPTSAAVELENHLARLKDELLFGAPTYISEVEDLEPKDPDKLRKEIKSHPYLVIRKVARSGQRIKVEVQYGREGDYDILLSQDGSQPVQLTGKAPSRTYRIWFLAPSVGESGFVVGETKGRTYAATALVHWLRVQNQQANVSFDEDNERVEDDWVRWDVREAFDKNRIDEVLRESHDHSVTLKRHSIDGAGNHFEGDLKLSQQGIPISKLDDVKAIIRKWWDNRNEKTPEKRKEAAAELGTILGMSSATSSLGFNDGEITFREKNKTQTISPNTIERLFVYPLGEIAPSNKALLNAALATIGPIAEDLQIEVDTTPS